MPGHKRRLKAEADPYAIDITEIDGFDNLHHAEEILKDAQRRAADLYGSKKAYYLVNGSTCGLLAAICAATRRRGEILIARNCHKAVYHGIYLQELTAHYLYPSITPEGIACAITPSAVQRALDEHPKVEAVLITSPTYDGIVSDIARIADIVHEKGIPLIVDEAHGAHFGLGKDSSFPDSAVHCGADMVILSLHKTLPSFTQTALLHICSDRISEAKVASFLDIFETSSPSYILMAGMERCIRMMAEEGTARLELLRRRLDEFSEKMKALARLRILTKSDFSKEQAFDFDASKLLIYTGNSNITGKQLYDLLLQKYDLQMEMAAGNYVLAMTSLMDTQEGFDRLAEALLAIDRSPDHAEPSAVEENSGHPNGEEEEIRARQVLQFGAIYAPQESICPIAQAMDAEHELISLVEAAGRTAADYIYLYPPGIPLLAPGERITAKALSDIALCRKEGLTVYGILPEERIEVVNFL